MPFVCRSVSKVITAIILIVMTSYSEMRRKINIRKGNRSKSGNAKHKLLGASYCTGSHLKVLATVLVNLNNSNEFQYYLTVP